MNIENILPYTPLLSTDLYKLTANYTSKVSGVDIFDTTIYNNNTTREYDRYQHYLSYLTAVPKSEVFDNSHSSRLNNHHMYTAVSYLHSNLSYIDPIPYFYIYNHNTDISVFNINNDINIYHTDNGVDNIQALQLNVNSDIFQHKRITGIDLIVSTTSTIPKSFDIKTVAAFSIINSATELNTTGHSAIVFYLYVRILGIEGEKQIRVTNLVLTDSIKRLYYFPTNSNQSPTNINYNKTLTYYYEYALRLLKIYDIYKNPTKIDFEYITGYNVWYISFIEKIFLLQNQYKHQPYYGSFYRGYSLNKFHAYVGTLNPNTNINNIIPFIFPIKRTVVKYIENDVAKYPDLFYLSTMQWDIGVPLPFIIIPFYNNYVKTPDIPKRSDYTSVLFTIDNTYSSLNLRELYNDIYGDISTSIIAYR